MSFQPTRCPNLRCALHVSPVGSRGSGRFYRRKGSFTRADEALVARFQCRACGVHFSEQTFDASYRQKRPDLNGDVRRLRAAGASIRATARLLGVDRKTASRRYRWLASRATARSAAREAGENHGRDLAPACRNGTLRT